MRKTDFLKIPYKCCIVNKSGEEGHETRTALEVSHKSTAGFAIKKFFHQLIGLSKFVI